VRGVSSEHRKTILSARESVPDFDLPALIGGVKKRLRLFEALADKNIVLAFYPSNWESVSGQQLSEYQSERSNLAAAHAEVVTISVDSIMNTTQWERELGPFDFPMCSDFWPHGKVSQAYGVFRDDGPHAGTAERAVFIVDRKRTVAFSKVYGRHELAPFSETVEALRRL
jgi:alkyl hydroperoxide reductase subunit AhpC